MMAGLKIEENYFQIEKSDQSKALKFKTNTKK
jgi:hypothetical protein